MDPIAIVGVTASSVTLLKLLTGGVLAVKTVVQGIRQVDEETESLAVEIDAFQITLSVLEHELGRSSRRPAHQQFLSPARLDGLLINAARTFSRLEEIYSEISRKRSRTLPVVRQYLRTVHRQEELGRLKMRITTYINALNIPAVLFAIHDVRLSPSTFDHGTAHTTVTQRLTRLDQKIGRLPINIQQTMSAQIERLEISIQQGLAQSQQRNAQTVENLNLNLEAVINQLSEALSDRIALLDRSVATLSEEVRSAIATAGRVETIASDTASSVTQQSVACREDVELIEIVSNIVIDTRRRGTVHSGTSTSASSVTDLSSSGADSESSISSRSTRNSTASASTIRPPHNERSAANHESGVRTPATSSSTSAIYEDLLRSGGSVQGAKMNPAKKGDIKSWLKTTGMKRSQPTREHGERSRQHQDNSTEVDTDSVFTASSQAYEDFEVEIARRRWETAQELIAKNDHNNAIKILKQILKELDSASIPSEYCNVTSIQFMLAKSMLQTQYLTEAQQLLRDLAKAEDLHPLKRAYAAASYARIILLTVGDDPNLGSNEVMTFAKNSYKIRREHLGVKDCATLESLRLLCDLCRQASHPDARVYEDMLPPDIRTKGCSDGEALCIYRSSAQDHRITMGVSMTDDGHLLTWCSNSSRSVACVYDLKTMTRTRESRYAGRTVCAAVVGDILRVINNEPRPQGAFHCDEVTTSGRIRPRFSLSKGLEHQECGVTFKMSGDLVAVSGGNIEPMLYLWSDGSVRYLEPDARNRSRSRSRSRSRGRRAMYTTAASTALPVTKTAHVAELMNMYRRYRSHLYLSPMSEQALSMLDEQGIVDMRILDIGPYMSEQRLSSWPRRRGSDDYPAIQRKVLNVVAVTISAAMSIDGSTVAIAYTLQKGHADASQMVRIDGYNTANLRAPQYCFEMSASSKPLAIALSSNGQYLAMLSQSGERSMLSVWTTHTRAQIISATLEQTGIEISTNHLVFSLDDKYLFVAMAGIVRLWNLPTPPQTPPPILSPAGSSDSRRTPVKQNATRKSKFRDRTRSPIAAGSTGIYGNAPRAPSVERGRQQSDRRTRMYNNYDDNEADAWHRRDWSYVHENPTPAKAHQEQDKP